MSVKIFYITVEAAGEVAEARHSYTATIGLVIHSAGKLVYIYTNWLLLHLAEQLMG